MTNKKIILCIFFCFLGGINILCAKNTREVFVYKNGDVYYLILSIRSLYNLNLPINL